MSVDLATLSTKLDLLLAEVRAMKAEPQAGLTQAEFARKLGKHPHTIMRWVQSGKIRLKNGVVPHETVARYLS